MGTSLVVQWIGIHFARARACAGSDQKGQLKAPKQKPRRQALQSIPYRQLQVVSSRKGPVGMHWVGESQGITKIWTNTCSCLWYKLLYGYREFRILLIIPCWPGDAYSICCTCVCACHMSTSFMVGASAHLGHWSLGVTLPARLNSGTSVGSPGLLRLWAALSLTCCSITALSTGSGGTGFSGSSPGPGSSLSSSAGCSSTSCFFFFFLALCWVRGKLISSRNFGISLKSSLQDQTGLGRKPSFTPISCMHLGSSQSHLTSLHLSFLIYKMGTIIGDFFFQNCWNEITPGKHLSQCLVPTESLKKLVIHVISSKDQGCTLKLK